MQLNLYKLSLMGMWCYPNQYTIDYNKEKLSFYKGAKIEIKEQKPEK